MHLRLFLKISSFFICFSLFCTTLEVALPTKAVKTPIYISEVYAPPSAFDWDFLEKIRDVLVSDFHTCGHSTVIGKSRSLEKNLSWPELQSKFNPAQWKEQKIPFVVAVEVLSKKLYLIVFDVQRGTVKKYPGVLLSGEIQQDRKEVHRLSSLVQKDLFGVSGIAHLKIIYAKRSKVGTEWRSDIWMCDADGENDQQVLTDEGYCVSPSFLPFDRSQPKEFMFVSYRDGQSKIYKMALGSHTPEMVLSLRGSQVLPSINRKGDQIAFITDAAGRPDLFIQNLGVKKKGTGKARQIFTAPNATQASPTYSPDGKQIAFVSDKGGSPRVYLIDVPEDNLNPSNDPKLLTKLNRENTNPSWSPDGTKIAYSAKVDGVRQIWLYDFITSSERAITIGPENKENPSWAPDSMHLVYNTEGKEKCELYRIHIIHQEPMLISKGPNQKRFASWSSR